MSIQLNSENLAKKIRLHALEMTHLGNSSHIGSIFSIADILAVLYSGILNVDPKNPELENRDRFILSKGHAGAGVYAALAETGFFPVDELKKHYSDGSIFSGHVSHKGVPGVEFSTGSLGHGLSVACGMALNAKLLKQSHRVINLMSDGECDEGSNWEAILFAPHHQLNNLVTIVDFNNLQSIFSTDITLNLQPFKKKWESFGWNVVEINGHSHKDLKQVLSPSYNSSSAPMCIIANTTKGKGVSFMENNNLWHYRSPQGKEYEDAKLELMRSDNA
ncbi:transketolase [Gammaproteobacteria bacterium]|nr:transketolase [Gammaproteobacteria bacterium]MDB9855545.1 transketolase [Gammaproteobacteria bacterium]